KAVEKITTIIVISTEGRNRTRDSPKIDDILYGASSAISPFGRNDKNAKTNFKPQFLSKLFKVLV
ncbi:hypothetical protein DBB36_22215, partial [Flavobacterium sp. WLB]|uniref:hypothetical protein n=1 Tax=Flavobacterium sp. WLB TaxID=2161662 RepID=UPI000DE7998C